MKLWKLEHPEPGYNHYAGFVIAAPSPVAARRIAQAQGGDETTRGGGVAFWTDPEKSRCTLLASESRTKEAGVVLASYVGD